MWKQGKQNTGPGKAAYSRLVQSQQELTRYLRYIRQKPSPPRIQVNVNFLKEQVTASRQHAGKEKKGTTQVRSYMDQYVRLVKEVSSMENYVGKKIIRKAIQYLQQFPSMAFLVEVVNAFGKQKKKLCLSEGILSQHATDDMVPLFQKIIQKIEALKKEAESKKLMELGHRIEHLQRLVKGAKGHVSTVDNNQIFKTFDADRVEKYLVMEENISRAEKNYGHFSQSFHKNKEVFSNINRVYLQINKATRSD